MNYELLSSCIDLASEAIIITEAQPLSGVGPKIVYVNKTFTRITGFTPEEAIGNTPRMLQGEKTARAVLDKIRSALERQEPIICELINYKKTGQPHWIELSIAPVYDEQQQLAYFISVQRDITEKKEQEKLVKAGWQSMSYRQMLFDAQQVTFHDLRTPIRNIFSFSQLITRKLKGHSNTDVKQYLGFLRDSVATPHKMVNSLQQMLSPEEQSLQLQDLEVKDVFEEASGILQQKIERLQAQLTLHGNAKVYADEASLLRVLYNLLDNALKYRRPTADIQIDVFVVPGKEHVSIHVVDNGKGFQEDFLQQAFELFTRGDQHVVGQGIGLALVNELMSQMGGEVHLANNEGCPGATVTLELPAFQLSLAHA